MKNYIAYHRVSTAEQGKSGLGLASQKEAIDKYIVGVSGVKLGEYTDVESGKKRERNGLRSAINHAANTGAVLVVKKLDRLSRGGHVILSELESKGVDFIEADSPYDNSLVKEIKLSIARDEGKKISERTSSALGMIQKQIAENGKYISKAGREISHLGTNNLTAAGLQNSITTRRKLAKENPENVKASVLIAALVKAGKSYYSITKTLNDAGFRTSRGNKFSQVQVKNLHLRV